MTTALERRIKRQVLAPPHELRVLGPLGLAEICAEEARDVAARFLHAQPSPAEVTIEDGGVRVRNVDFRNVLQLLYEAKSARDILWRIGGGRAASRGALAAALDGIDWDLLLPRGAEVACRTDSRRSRVYHEGLIRDVFSERLAARGFRPAAKGAAPYLVDLRLDRDELTAHLSLTSGDLYRRGVKRKLIAKASVREDLAAGAISWAARLPHAPDVSSADERLDVLVPFAGSGTLGLEAALRFGRIPLSAMPRAYAAERFPCTPQASVKYIQSKLESAAAQAPRITVKFLERDARECAALRDNAAAFAKVAPEGPRYEVAEGDVFADDAWLGETTGSAFVALNPPYGERLAGSEELYFQIGTWLVSLAKRGYAHLFGFAFAPDDAAADALSAPLASFSLARIEVRHGGRRAILVGFGAS